MVRERLVELRALEHLQVRDLLHHVLLLLLVGVGLRLVGGGTVASLGSWRTP